MSQALMFFLLLFVTAFAFKAGVALNLLTAGNALFGNQTQYLNNSDYYLVMQPDCDLVMYQGSSLANSHRVWHTNTTGQGSNCWLLMQPDGNMVVYNASCYHTPCAVWNSVTFQYGIPDSSFYFILQSNGSLDIYNFPNDNPKLYSNILSSNYVDSSSKGAPPSFNVSVATTPTLSFYGPFNQVWNLSSTGYPIPYMSIGYYLPVGSSLQSGTFSLTLQNHCTLQSLNVSSGMPLWETPSNGFGIGHQCELRLLQDGNLQLQTIDSNEIVWASNLSGDPTVNWVLYIDSTTGVVSIQDIMQRTDILWNNSFGLNHIVLQRTNTSHHGKSFILLLVGVFTGGFLLGLTSLILPYYACAGLVDPIQKELQQRLQNGGRCQKLTSAQIKQATNNFQRTLGIGGFGGVYYGKLVNGQEVAVKTLSTTSHQTKQEFFNEIELLSTVHHKSLVSLVGYCLAREHLMLVYEYVSGGDLRNTLNGEGANKTPLTWNQRTRIILQVAEGLEYLHHKCHPTIIHRDVKSSNILLTNKLEAKVADFGLSKLRAIEQGNTPTHITTIVKGTPGYLDPEYQENGMLTNKSDVYGFGIVMMEILTGDYILEIQPNSRIG